MTFSLDYGKMISLDAEDLAECGIKEAYDRIANDLRRYVSEPAPIQEIINSDEGNYSVRSDGTEYEISSPTTPDDEGQSWGRATYALFKIINGQMKDSEYRFYAINGGNDLGGLFLTLAEADAARRSLPRKSDWPYLPTLEHPRYGAFHNQPASRIRKTRRLFRFW